MNRWNIPNWLEREVIARDRSCVYCGVEFTEQSASRRYRPSWEHIINDARIITRENIARCCIGCNASKGTKNLLESRAVIDSAMLKTNLLILTLLASKLTFAASAETTQVKTPRGVSVNVAINVPDSSVAGKRPAVIIAPGAGYHMELPIIKELAEKLAAAGVLAFRFDWNYYATDPAKGQSSAGLSKELEDMQSVVNLAKADARVDAGQIIIAGKSMGSVVAFNVFIRDRSAKAVVLLTPLCSSTTDDKGNAIPNPRAVGALNYPTLTDLTKPIVMMLGNSDPACFVPNLFDWLKASKGNVVTVVVGGDHGLNMVSNNFEDPRNAANISASVQIVSHWIKLIVEK